MAGTASEGLRPTGPGWWWAKLATGAKPMVYRVTGFDDGMEIGLYSTRRPLAEMEKFEGFEWLAPVPIPTVCLALVDFDRADAGLIASGGDSAFCDAHETRVWADSRLRGALRAIREPAE